ncbi:ZrgA family zinc uptake protein [Alloalcanivorax mobilis]|uniref:ZrgA family zinc uptake protein n=1 Tax=Alloalcanivorax mobilis TaxID=2019569 RepID=UPI0012FFF6A6|nr:DUF2796 domain-containing protein [Alloalcanivorax mobilis]
MHGRIWILLALLPMMAMADPPDAARGELRMALKGQALVAHLSLPAPVVVGFDHAPAGDDENMAVTDALARLGKASNVLEPLAEAGCEVTREGVETGLAPLEQGDAPASKPASNPAFQARYAWHCATPQALLAVDVPLLEFLNGVALDTLVVTDQGQRSLILAAPQTRLPIVEQP